MGWTSWNTENDKRRFPTAGDYLADSYTRQTSEGATQTVVAHRTVAGVWYAALRVQGQAADDYTRAAYANPADFTTALVVLTEGSWGGNWGEKGMDEGVGPSEARCPASVLNKLTPLTDHRYAESARGWRASCREVAAGRRAA